MPDQHATAVPLPQERKVYPMAHSPEDICEAVYEEDEAFYVRAAGEADLSVFGKTIEPSNVNPRSGHCQPPGETVWLGVDAMRKEGVHVPDVVVSEEVPSW